MAAEFVCLWYRGIAESEVDGSFSASVYGTVRKDDSLAISRVGLFFLVDWKFGTTANLVRDSDAVNAQRNAAGT